MYYSGHAKGGEIDIAIFRRRIAKHEHHSEKFEDDGNIADTKEDQEIHWTVLAIKGYKGIQETTRVINPKKKLFLLI